MLSPYGGQRRASAEARDCDGALALSFPLLDMGTVTIAPTPNPPVPNNPAIEDDQLKVFVSMTA